MVRHASISSVAGILSNLRSHGICMIYLFSKALFLLYNLIVSLACSYYSTDEPFFFFGWCCIIAALLFPSCEKPLTVFYPLNWLKPICRPDIYLWCLTVKIVSCIGISESFRFMCCVLAFDAIVSPLFYGCRSSF